MLTAKAPRKGKSRKNAVNARFENDSADILGGLKSADLVAEMLKIPQTEVELPEQFVAQGFEDGRIYVLQQVWHS